MLFVKVLLLFLALADAQRVQFNPDRNPAGGHEIETILSLLDSTSLTDKFDEAVRRLDESSEEKTVPKSTSKISEDDVAPREMEQIVNVFDKASTILGSLLGGDRSRIVMPRVSLRGTSRNGPMDDDKTISLLDKITGIPMKITGNLQGAHICIRETTRNLKVADDADVSIDKKCQRFQDAYVCTSRTVTKQGGKETRRIQECCEGFTTENIFDGGCEIEATPDYEKVRLDALNLTDVQSGNLIITDTQAFLLDKSQDIYEWADGEDLKTTSGEVFVVKQTDGDLTKFTLNCEPVSTIIRRTSGTILKVDEVSPAAGNLLQLVKNIPELSTFVDVLGDDLRDYLESSNGATIFAFSNTAFDSLPGRVQEQIRSRSSCVPDLLKQHIVTSGAFCASDLPLQMDTLYGSRLTYTNHRGQLKVGGANVIRKNAYAMNGVVHVIDQVLVTENFLSWRETLSQYNSELEAALGGHTFTHPITILVPEQNTTDFTNTTALNYIVSGRLLTKLSVVDHIVTDANSTFFTRSSSGSSPFQMRISMRDLEVNRGRVACSRLTQAPVHACQAVLQFLDKPLPIINETIDQFLERRQDLSRFQKVWKASNVSEGAEMITVFIPSDDAFSNNQFKKMLKNADAYVKNHVVRDPLCDYDLTRKKFEIRKSIYSTIGAQMISPETIDDENFINGARVQESEIILSDAIVYILESEMEKPKGKKSTEHGGSTNPFNVLAHVLPLTLLG